MKKDNANKSSPAPVSAVGSSAASATAKSEKVEMAAKEYTVTWRFDTGTEIRKTNFRLSDQRISPETKRWTYVLRNRERLGEGLRNDEAALYFEPLERLFIPESNDSATKFDFKSFLGEIAASGLLEVSLPWSPKEEDLGDAARLFPWEMVLDFLTRPYRTPGQMFTVVRQLDVGEGADPVGEPKTLLAVSNAPGKIAELFKLIGECRLVENVLGLSPCAGGELTMENPEINQLKERIKSGKPDVVHLTGVDPMWLLNSMGSQGAHRGLSNMLTGKMITFLMADVIKEKVRDGLVVSGPNGTISYVFAKHLAEVVTAGGHAPRLVAVSACYSGRRVAPQLVAAGAHAAIGFQDSVTDAEAETFFSAFYRLWRSRRWPHPALILSEALRSAISGPAQSLDLVSGAIIWSRHSVFALGSVKVEAASDTRKFKVIKLELDRDLEVVLKPVTTLNYSLLHNRRCLFTKLYVRKNREGILPPLTVKIQLDVGASGQPCIFSCPLPQEARPLDLRGQVSTPLVAPLLRRVSESLRSNLYLHVACGNDTVCETTRPITIMPVDEWRDDGKDHCWLPSFVLPRDPAVLKIITVALRYLRAIADDPQAGFSGYQGISPDGSDAVLIVDPQVRAIWAALQQEFRLAYINPPPSYTLRAQRLRSPSQILAGGAATCIDLALLFAGCLEYIGILPAIFLIQGHAFVGYWRDEGSWGGLENILKEADEAIAANPDETDVLEDGSSGEQQLGAKWMLSGVAHFPALTGYIRSQSLVPIESTFVTANRSFSEAISQGRDNLHPRTFDAMIDIGRARNNDVTPLPIIDG